ncbi:MAG TPA: ABC transporter permease subunit [Candidatus Acidoferrales bacterium]|nr:ABC transporter permease subunit [Candidatus Acidoferrales bacterium]
MKNVWAIYRKEMGHYFVSPIAYVFIGIFLILGAYFFNVILGYAIQQSFSAEMEGMRYGMMQNFDVPSEVTRQFFGLLSTLVLFITPILTMAVYSEERKRGTMELLMTSPITEGDIVLGKFLASFSLFALMILPTVSYLAFMYFRSDPMPPWRVLWVGYLGVLLLGASLTALGTFISSLTENSIIAAVLTFAAFLLVWVLDIGRNASGAVASVLTYLSVIRHYEDFTRGVIDTSSLVYYASFIFLFVFLTVRSVDSMRWRRA